MRRARLLLVFLIFVQIALRADVTIRYESDTKAASFLPSGVVQTPAAFPPSVIRIKGSKMYTSAGASSSILDTRAGQITLIDSDHKTVASGSLQEYTDRAAAALSSITSRPDVQKAMESMKTSVSSRKTGRTETIQGVEGEETEVTLSIDLPLPAELKVDGPALRMVMHVWMAKPEEATRNQALREYMGFREYSKYMMGSPAVVMERMFSQMPGFGKDALSGLQDSLKNSSLMLRSHIELYSSLMAKLAPLMEQQGHPLPAGFDPNGPMMQMNIEVKEISTATIADSTFDLPADYQKASFDDAIRSVIANAGGAAAPK